MTSEASRTSDRPEWSDRNAIHARLHELFTRELDVVVPADETDLLTAGILDSLALVELLSRIEEVFGLTIELEELDFESFRSVRSITEFIAARQHAAFGGLHDRRRDRMGSGGPT